MKPSLASPMTAFAAARSLGCVERYFRQVHNLEVSNVEVATEVTDARAAFCLQDVEGADFSPRARTERIYRFRSARRAELPQLRQSFASDTRLDVAVEPQGLSELTLGRGDVTHPPPPSGTGGSPELLLQQQVRPPPEGQSRPSKGLIAKVVQSKDLTVPKLSLCKEGIPAK